jgi:Uma2 family endonuclease
VLKLVITLDNKPLSEPYLVHIWGKSFEQFLEFANEDISCELLNGVLIIHSPASFQHESIFKFLITILELYSSKKDIGTPLGSRFVMKLSNEWALEPDILFITNEMKKNIKTTYLDGPAEVVFEILSRSTRIDNLTQKLPQYLKSGVKEVWIIDPEEKLITIHWAKSNKKFIDDQWAESKFIKGFKIKSKWLWDSPISISVTDALTELEKKT